MKYSICGNDKYDKEFREFWKLKGKGVNKSEFIKKNMLRDLGLESESEIFEDDEVKLNLKKIIDVILVNISSESDEHTFDNMQEYIKFIIKRDQEEGSHGKKKV